MAVGASDTLLQESCLQKFKYLRLDITRLKEEIGYPDMKGGYAQIRVCTLDPGTPTSKLVVSKKLHFDPEWKPGRLACVGQVTSFCFSRIMIFFHSKAICSGAQSLGGSSTSAHLAFTRVLPGPGPQDSNLHSRISGSR